MPTTSFELQGDNSNLLAVLKQTEAEFYRLGSSAEQAGVGIDQAIGRAKSLAASMAGIAGLSFGGMALINQIKNVRSEMQNTEAMFKVFLKSGERASAFMTQLQNYAFNNVFEFSDLAQQSAQLLAYGTAQDQVIDRLDRLSNVAAGANVPLGELVSTYNKVKATDKIDSRTEQSLAAKGIKIRELLEQMKGLDSGTLDGVGLRFKDLEDALRAATDEGGMYFGMMEEKMKTLGDKVGLLQDSVTNMLNEMGEELQDILGGGLEIGSKLADNWREVVEILTSVAVMFGTVKAAMALDKAFNNAQRLQALRFEEVELKKLEEATQRYTLAVKRQEVAELQAARAEGKLTSSQATQLAKKEKELRDMENDINLKNAVNAGIMTEAEAKHIVEIEKKRQAKQAYWESVQKNLDAELSATDELIAQEVADWNNPELKSAIDTIGKKKTEVANIKMQYDSNATYIQSLKDEITALQNDGLAKEAAAKMDELWAAEKKQAALSAELLTAQTELDTARKEVNTVITNASTASEELNALARDSNSKMTQRQAATVALETTQTTRDVIATNALTKAKMIGTVAIKAAHTAFKSFMVSMKASMASNPLGWIMLAVEGLIALGTWLYKIATAETAAQKAQNAMNDAISGADASSANEIRQLDTYIGAIKRAKEAGQDYTAIKQKMINQFSQYDENLRTEIEDVIAGGAAYDRLAASIRNVSMEQAKQTYSSEINNTINENTKKMLSGKNGKGGVRGELKHNEVSGQDQGYIEATIMEVLSDTDALMAADTSGNGKYSAKEVEALFRQKLGDAKFKELADATGDWEDVSDYLEDYLTDTAALLKQQQDILTGEVMKTEEVANSGAQPVGKSLSEVIQEIHDAETALAQAQAAVAASATKENVAAVKEAEETLKAWTDKYKAATGKTWKDSKQVQEQITKDLQKAANERIKIQNSQIQEERKRRVADMNQQIAEIRQQAKEWSKENNGRKNKAFDKQIENIKLQFEFDDKELTRKFNEWKKDFEKNILKINIGMQTSFLEKQIELATTYAEKIDAQNRLFEYQLQLKKQDTQTEIEKTFTDKYGENSYTDFSENYREFNGLKTANDLNAAAEFIGYDKSGEDGGAEAKAQLIKQLQEQRDIYLLYKQQEQAEITQMEQQQDFERTNTMLSNFEKYLSDRTSAEEQYLQDIAAIREKYGLDEDVNIENAPTDTAIGKEVQQAKNKRQRAIDKTTIETGMSGDVKELTDELAGLNENVGKQAMEELMVLYDNFIAEVQAGITECETKINAAQALLDGSITAEEIPDRIAELEAMQERGTKDKVDENGNVILDENGNAEQVELSDTERVEIEREIAELKQAQVYSKMSEAELEAVITDEKAKRGELQAVEDKAEKDKDTNMANALSRSQMRMKAWNKTSDKLVDSFQNISQSAKLIGSTFGGALSKNAKKALNAISSIADGAASTISVIKNMIPQLLTLIGTTTATSNTSQAEMAAVTAGASAGMTATASAAATAIRTVETASVILAIISAALQMVQAIANAVMQFTADKKMQESIDKHKENVEDLKRRNEELQRAFKSEVGIDYYKGMAKAANDYTNIINEQKKALQEAQELYEYQKDKNGEDSDKAKDAKDQVNELQDGLNELEDSREEELQELRDSLLGTDLHSFSENLADSLIEGFENGKEGISDTWNDMLNDLLTSMMKKQLAMQLEKQFEGVFDKMNSMVDTDGVLSQSEINEIVDLMNGASAGAQQIAEAYYDLMDEMGLLTDSDEEGSKGGFESMSQDTADELNARFTALQITGANMDATMQTMSQAIIELNVSDKLKMTILQTLQENIIMGVQTAQNQLDELRIIADNTGMLNETNRRLKAIEQHTAKL